MFLALIREGEIALTPSRREVLILGTFAGMVKVRYVVTEEEFEIHPRYLQPATHLPRQPLAGAQVEQATFMDELMERLDNGKG